MGCTTKCGFRKQGRRAGGISHSRHSRKTYKLVEESLAWVVRQVSRFLSLFMCTHFLCCFVKKMSASLIKIFQIAREKAAKKVVSQREVTLVSMNFCMRGHNTHTRMRSFCTTGYFSISRETQARQLSRSESRKSFEALTVFYIGERNQKTF